MGILEQIDSKLDLILEQLGQSPVVVAEPVTTTPVIEPGVETTEQSDPYAGVDVQGVPWDERIHSKAKEPKAATGKNKGCWKRKKGIVDELYESVLEELKTATPDVLYWVHDTSGKHGTAKDQNELAMFSELQANLRVVDKATYDAFAAENSVFAPEAPTVDVPQAPTAPGVPEVPSAPTVDVPPAPEVNTDKTACIATIKELTADYNVDPADITEVMLEKGGADTLDKVAEANMAELKLALTTWLGWLKLCQDAVDEMTDIAKVNPVYVTSLDDGLKKLYSPYSAETLGSVHPESLSELSGKLDAYLASWRGLKG